VPVVIFHAPQELLERLDHFAEENGLSRSEAIRMLLLEKLREREVK